MNWEPISETNLPDSDVQVIVVDTDGETMRLVTLEFTDDSEGNAEPYWTACDEPGSCFPIDDFTHWCVYEPPGAQ